MPAYIPGPHSALGLKLVSTRPQNTQIGLPTILSQVLLVNPITSEPLAFMDATYLTLLRTSAGSGAATRYLCRKDVKKMAIFGAGALALPHLEAMVSERPSIQTIAIVNRSIANSENLLQKLKEDERFAALNIYVTDDAKEALSGALLVVTCTGSHEPLFDGNHLERGTHLNLVGAFTADSREVDAITIKRSKVVVDHRKSAELEAGDIVLAINEGVVPPDHVLAELGEVVLGKKIRISDEDITLFKSVGNAVQDVSVGFQVLVNARRKGLGTRVTTQ
eukprot:TRINITY_DN1440_c0_g1_i5.p1 TRINITY_DN1440_c0_g1~~TRINITY_DN1440_c0_g1_i5.p1  ORF type:complete len:278 (-),score=46.05 TRINITY_DN1440_c0_g1_i5:107-940(-)